MNRAAVERRIFVVAAALLALSSSPAPAALTAAEQRCIATYNKKLRLVSKQAGKSCAGR